MLSAVYHMNYYYHRSLREFSLSSPAKKKAIFTGIIKATG